MLSYLIISKITIPIKFCCTR